MALYTSDNARRSMIDTVSLRVVSQAATILGYIVMVRAMSREDFGVFNLLYAFIPVVSTIASLGLEQTLRRYQPEYLREGNVDAAAWLVRFVASARLGVSVILLGGIFLAWNHVAPLFKLTPFRAQFAIFAVLIVLHFQARILQLSLASRMLQRYSVGSMAVLSVGKLIGYSALAWWGGLSLDRAILVDVAAFAATYAFMFGAHRRHVTAAGAKSFRPAPAERRRLLRYGLLNNFNDAGTLALNSKSDNFFIAAIIDPVSVGIYSFYTRLNEMAYQLLPVRLFQNVVQPMLFAVPKAEADRKIPDYFTLLVNMNLLLQWPMLAYVTAFHAEIVQVIFGGKFVENSWLLPIIVGFATLNAVDFPVTFVAQYEEKAGVILASKAVGIYNVVALLALLPWFGVAGAAIATGSAQVLKSGFIWWHIRRSARWANAFQAVLFSLALWGGAVVLCRYVKTAANLAPAVSLVAGMAVMGVCALVHLRGPAISARDRGILAAVLHGREARLLALVGLLPRRGRARPEA